MHGHLSIAKLVLRHDEQVINLDEKHGSGFRFACYQGQTEVVKYLLRRFREPILADEHKTPHNGLTWALSAKSADTSKGRLQVIDFLLETAPTLLYVPDMYGRYPLEVALREDRAEIYDAILKRFQAPIGIAQDSKEEEEDAA